jgi:oligopeptide transport system substrate-binding protein
MKKLSFIITLLLAASCSSGAAPATETTAAVENTRITTAVGESPAPPTEAPTAAANEIIQGTEVVPISEMAAEIPWLETDPKAVPMTTFIGININTPPFDNLLVRKAFSLAINRQKIADGDKSRGRDSAVPATTFIPPQTLGVDLSDLVGLNFNAGEAKQALTDAGYSDVSQLPAIEIVFYEGSTDLVNAYLEMWKSALGVDVKPVPVQSGVELYDYIDNQKPGLFILGAWIADTNDPNNFTKDIFLDPQSHYPLLAGTQFADLVNQAESAASDPKARQALYIQAEKLLSEDQVYVIPVEHATTSSS